MTSLLKILKGLLTTSEMKSHCLVRLSVHWVLDGLVDSFNHCMYRARHCGWMVSKASSVSVLPLLPVE